MKNFRTSLDNKRGRSLAPAPPPPEPPSTPAEEAPLPEEPDKK